MTDENVARNDEPLMEVKDERINGKVYMMTSASFWHSNVTRNIYLALNAALGDGPCRAFMENFDFKYHPNCDDERLRGDYVCPDIMIICDRSKIKGGAYYGVPNFIAEVLSPSTAHKDRTTKMKIYEEAGVSEYWMISPDTLDIYYLNDGKYRLEKTLILCEDAYDQDYNADTVIVLRCFPAVNMTLEQIFADLMK